MHSTTGSSRYRSDRCKTSPFPRSSPKKKKASRSRTRTSPAIHRLARDHYNPAVYPPRNTNSDPTFISTPSQHIRYSAPISIRSCRQRLSPQVVSSPVAAANFPNSPSSRLQLCRHDHNSRRPVIAIITINWKGNALRDTFTPRNCARNRAARDTEQSRQGSGVRFFTWCGVCVLHH